ncbi:MULTISPECIES: ABC transporter substrate-binding protein [unclassified Mycobacterium]|uniref:ABC transporter substrate-binding protein n=1 Tax=unclassified Mycobacterium TaxID=2642494 RepID=UPI00074030C3|nr:MULTISPECIES: ABC transporter substrate-binding protein [unclassified Mycobacterium]KUH87710.1 ABC transporter substrate-binding protein [Mycobacterium sp. GA-1999]KUH90702.1 ABC transporter substrate-binding protein [Mycobacterium sp. IS-1556]KUH90962.1 ABC transporter substrate-binding protein [Mycobacterium sp. GA-0227b]
METLRVATAIPYPPFISDEGGLDVDLMHALGEHLGATAEFVDPGSAYDCVTGTTVTSEADMLPPYVISGQALAVDARRSPRVRSVDDLVGLTIGVRRGDTGQSIADRLAADGKAGAVRSYDSIVSALTDLGTGACDAVIALAPVLTELVRPIPGVDVVQRGLSTEDIAIAVAPGDQALLGRLTVAQAELEADGTLQRIRREWLGNPYTDQSLTVH